MATDYILFVHGVNNRSEEAFRQQALQIFERIQANISPNSSRTLKPVVLFWGNVSQTSIEVLFKGLNDAPSWKQFWFQNLRNQQVIPFVGDAALYLSRTVSTQIIQQMTQQALDQMRLSLEALQAKSPVQGDFSHDRLHLVTHSWGTVILFDILFASRWEDSQLPAETRQAVQNIRSSFFGVGNPAIQDRGIPIASIHTMGSPIALFNLINASGGKSFDLTPNLKTLLASLYATTNKPLPWFNYAHPGDPIAYPLEGIMPLTLDEAIQYVRIQDIISPTSFWEKPLSQTVIPLLFGGDAHSSYWKTDSVAKTIGGVIQSTFS
jgi:hypothetical protein